jgi:hypothetical protein
MFKEFAMFVKYPYTAGILGTMWISTAIIYAIKQDIPIIKMVGINMVASLLIAYLGFHGKKEA